MIERLAELTSEPVVGRFYLVPCVRGVWYGRMGNWPVLLPFHEDRAVIGFEPWHYHLDRRFLPNLMFADTGILPVLTPAGRMNRSPLQVSPKCNPDGLPPPVERRRKCRRRIGLLGYDNVRWAPALRADYREDRLRPGMICPHKGVCLATMPVIDGVVECPAHGLRWDVATGRLVEPAGEGRP